jgi:hypothetical protein
MMTGGSGRRGAGDREDGAVDNAEVESRSGWRSIEGVGAGLIFRH